MYKEKNIKNLKISISNDANQYIFIPTIGLHISSKHQSNQILAYTVILAFINYNLKFKYVTINKNYKPQEAVTKYDIIFSEVAQSLYFRHPLDKANHMYINEYYSDYVIIYKGCNFTKYIEFEQFVKALHKGNNLTKESLTQYMIDFDIYKSSTSSLLCFS